MMECSPPDGHAGETVVWRTGETVTIAEKSDGWTQVRTEMLWSNGPLLFDLATGGYTGGHTGPPPLRLHVVAPLLTR